MIFFFTIKFNGNAILLFSFLSFSYWLNSYGKEFCSYRNNFFPLRVDSFLEGFHRPGKQTGTHKKLFSSVKRWKNINVYPYKYMYL